MNQGRPCNFWGEWDGLVGKEMSGGEVGDGSQVRILNEWRTLV
jgi:hypothetical protein